MRTRAGQAHGATLPDATAHWREGKQRLTAQVWNGLVLPDARPGRAAFRVVAIFDARSSEPLLLATNLDVSAEAL